MRSSAIAVLPAVSAISARQAATPAPAGFDLLKDGEEDAQTKVQAQTGTVEQISAADYDPSLDRREDEEKRVRAVVDQTQNQIEMIEEEEEDHG